MDAGFNIYEIPEEQQVEPDQVTKEDVARLQGFLKGRAESDRQKHEKVVEKIEKRGKLVWDSQTQGTYRKKDHGKI